MPDFLPVSLQNFLYRRKPKLRKQVSIHRTVHYLLEHHYGMESRTECSGKLR